MVDNMSYFGINQREEGGERRALVSDERVIGLLEQIFTVLKKIEYHQMLASDTNLNDEDV